MSSFFSAEKPTGETSADYSPNFVCRLYSKLSLLVFTNYRIATNLLLQLMEPALAVREGVLSRISRLSRQSLGVNKLQQETNRWNESR
jgi:hypothetical protein